MPDATLQRRIIQTLNDVVSCFDPIPTLQGFARPLQSIGFKAVFSELSEDQGHLAEGYPWGLSSQRLIAMNWGGIGSNHLSYSAFRMPDRTSIYVRHQLDYFDAERDCLIASAKIPTPSVADKTFLTNLIKTNGAVFGERIFGSPPVEFEIQIERKILPELLRAAFEDAFSNNNDEVWNELVELVSQRLDGDIDWSEEICTAKGKLRLLRSYVQETVTSP